MARDLQLEGLVSQIWDLPPLLTPWCSLAYCNERRLFKMIPQPIREIAPPAWPLPLISNPPRGPRRLA